MPPPLPFPSHGAQAQGDEVSNPRAVGLHCGEVTFDSIEAPFSCNPILMYTPHLKPPFGSCPRACGFLFEIALSVTIATIRESPARGFERHHCTKGHHCPEKSFVDYLFWKMQQLPHASPGLLLCCRTTTGWRRRIRWSIQGFQISHEPREGE